jgi:nucleotide-binding universal stress UspA family protein
MRVFLVVMDDTVESRAALRFAARRAAAVEGAVHILALTPQQNVSAFGAVQATIEQEARDRVEMLAHGAAGNLFNESGIMPSISVRTGKGQSIINEFLAEHDEVGALVLGAAPSGNPGPLVTHFSSHAGALPCPLYVIPGNYDEEADAN